MAPKASLLLLAPTLLTLLALPCSQGAVSNIVTDWSFALQKGLATYNIRHQIGLRFYALLHQAQFYTVKASRAGNYKYNETVLVATASHFVLSSILPDQQSSVYDGLLASQVGSTNITLAYAFARSYVSQILKSRIDDGSTRWANFVPAPAGSPAGQYQFTPGQTFAIYPQLGSTTPFGVKWTSIPSIYSPPSVNSSAFLTQVEEVYRVGGKTPAATWANDSTRNTSDFWADGTGTSQHGGHWNTIAISILPATLNTNIVETARVLAYLNVAAYDANIVTWKLKYGKRFWRPITAIQQGFGAFTPDPTWLPYLSTPAHPEYPSGHSTTAGAFGKGLALYLKTDTVTVTVATEGKTQGGLPLAPRTYSRISDIVAEVSVSRIYGGIHYRQSVVDGQSIGAAFAAQAQSVVA